MADIEETELRTAGDGAWLVGANCHRIVMRRDGVGPMGWYDMIHVYDYNGNEIQTVPAHQAANWEVTK